MAFAKKPKLCQDAPAGLQHLNGLNDNLDSFKTDFELEHAPLSAASQFPSANVGHNNFEPPLSPLGGEVTLVAASGAHEHPLVPRGMAFVGQVTSLGDPTVISSYGVQLVAAAGCLQTLEVLDTGVYFFAISGFAKVWGHGTVQSDLVSPLLAGLAHDIKVQPGVQSSTGATGLVVRTFRLQENGSSQDELLPFHTGFFLVAYGRRSITPSPPAGVEPLRRSRFRRGPLRRFPSRGR